jgi:transcriptional pleiotropic regulator of transition state genes
MISTGIVRRVSDTGKFNIPLAVLQELKVDFNHAKHVEYFIGEDCIGIRFFETGCMFCHSIDNVRDINGKRICNTCIEDIKRVSKK